MPILIGAIALISGLTSVDAAKQMEEPSNFNRIYVYDTNNVVEKSFLVDPFASTEDIDASKKEVMENDTYAFVKLSDNFMKI